MHWYNLCLYSVLAVSKILNNLVSKDVVKTGSVVARISGNVFYLYTVTAINKTAPTGDKYTLSPACTQPQVYNSIAWSTHASGKNGVANVIGMYPTDYAFSRIGSCVINLEATTNDSIVYVNGYNYVYDETKPFSDNRYAVTSNTKCKFGTCPTDVAIIDDIVKNEYDVLLFDEESTKDAYYTPTSIDVSSGTSTGFSVSDVVYIKMNNEEIPFTVSEVSSGSITKITANAETYPYDIKCTDATLYYKVSTVETDTNATVTIDTSFTEATGRKDSVNTAVVSTITADRVVVQIGRAHV